MNESGEIMTNTNTAPEVSEGASTADRVTTVKDAATEEAQSANHDVDEKNVKKDESDSSTPLGEDADTSPKDIEGKDDIKNDEDEPKTPEELEREEAENKALAEASEDELRQELESLQRELLGEEESLEPGQEEVADELAQEKEKLKKEKSEGKLVVDIGALFRRMLAILKAILGRFAFLNILPKDTPENGIASGKDIGISKDPFGTPEGEREALRLGLIKRTHADSVDEFEKAKGTQADLLNAASTAFNEPIYKKEKEVEDIDVNAIMKKDKTIKRRISKLQSELVKRKVASTKKA